MDYDVKLLDLPTSIHGFVRVVDGHATIILNARLSYDMQQDCFEHEKNHLLCDDFNKVDADAIEMSRHGHE